MKRVLITGGSSGIGAATARVAAARGWTVAIGYRSGRHRAEALVQELMPQSPQTFAVRCVLEESGSVQLALDLIQQLAGGLEALVLSASPAPQLASLLKATETEWRTQWESNVLGNQRLLVECWKRFLRPSAHGVVVGVLSTASEPPVRGHMSGYITAKRGLQALLECALAEFGAGGLRCATVSPDYTETPMLENFHAQVLAAARARQPNGHFLSATQVAETILQVLEHPPEKPSLASHVLRLPYGSAA